jgi:hypothetical protein
VADPQISSLSSGKPVSSIFNISNDSMIARVRRGGSSECTAVSCRSTSLPPSLLSPPLPVVAYKAETHVKIEALVLVSVSAPNIHACAGEASTFSIGRVQRKRRKSCNTICVIMETVVAACCLPVSPSPPGKATEWLQSQRLLG